jgi:Asp-tRNA(Asn)/Glu-tRNA(Gln) amidotransferase B subunit
MLGPVIPVSTVPLGTFPYDASVLTGEKVSVDFFYRTLEICPNAKLVCNWLTSELFGALNA